MTKWAQATAVLVCVGSAFALAWHGADGWGWFLFVGVLIASGL